MRHSTIPHILIAFAGLGLLPAGAEAQTLDEIVNVYALRAPQVRKLRMAYQNAILEYENYRKSFLPSIGIQLSPVSFNRSLRLLQNPVDGNYNYVKDYSYTGSTGISISQKIGPTGGSIQLGSDLSYLREFSDKRNSFSTSPLYISYSQPLFGEYRKYKLTREIQQVNRRLALRQFCQGISGFQQEVAALYLNVCSAKLRLEQATQDIATGDTLLRMAKLRKDNGYITQFDYNKIDLQQVQTRQERNQAENDLHNSMSSLLMKLDSNDELLIVAPEAESLPEIVEETVVREKVRDNNPQLISIELQRKQAEYNHYTSRLSSKFNGNISLSYGLNQYAENFADAYKRPDERQSISITLSIPIFQWGIAHNNRIIADNTLETAEIESKASVREFEESIGRQTFNYNISRNDCILSKRNLELSKEQYRLAVMKFGSGNISVYELTQAFTDQQRALAGYFASVKQVFTQYYSLRHLALYDFATHSDLADVFVASQEMA
ncbi:MAG: TolC family protein [Prevotella sp.]|nr:TolC family protein [Prevotella sp.]